ncbi:LANO_0G03642g1_1 [Lachancea nothofagi CBS 11611]|uniref:LANO_0G03642g1_1 n=1 Tax=Lachancea nothofagi CBS 11611 TaxID=1266666 RepID=A0A1G4KFZ5_9SACH|nr:LANO_0G03642g1_1 [Lachancea nothofagi CBS 11611]
MLLLKRKLLLSCFAVLGAIVVLFSVRNLFNPTPTIRERVYTELFENIEKFRPIRPPKDRYAKLRLPSCDMSNTGINTGDSVERTTYENLDHCYHISKTQFEGLQAPHTGFLTSLKTAFNYEEGSSVLDYLFPEEKGFVTVGGGRFSLLSYTMIKTLRERGSKLPIEVIIPPQDEKGEAQYCNEILPQLNARCVFFSDVLPSSLVENWTFEKYQIKAVALLISSFKKIVFIDADDYPLKSIDSIFESKVVQEHGLVLWPDLWRRATAPVFYRLANIEVSLMRRVRNLGDDVTPVSHYQNTEEELDLKKIPFHDMQGTVPDPTTESGQMVIDKVRHFRTLLLALYYNVYGPQWYYSLFSQGTAGEGDKETFATAAHVLGLPYYQVKTKLAFDGYYNPDPEAKNDFRGVALYQHDCTQDFELHEKARLLVLDKIEEYKKFNKDYNPEENFYKDLMKPEDKSDIDVMFAHASFHKFDPWQLYHENVYLKPDGSQLRTFRNLKKINNFDIELFNFEVLQAAMCSEKPIQFAYFQDKLTSPEWPQVCEYVANRVKFLKETHDEATGKA